VAFLGIGGLWVGAFLGLSKGRLLTPIANEKEAANG
jgi:hypothetical protein